MPQFLVVAQYGPDPDAQVRRLEHQAVHQAGIQAMVKKGEVILAGRISDDANNGKGAALLMEFSSRAELDQWMRREPYIVNKVWGQVDVTPIAITYRAE